jgi:acetate kinase
MTDIMNKKSGFIGLQKKSSDMRDMVTFSEQGDERAQLVRDMVVHHITKLVGGYIAEMNGVDLIIFTAGIAENNPWLPLAVCKHFEYMGLKMDEAATNAARDEAIISAPDSSVKVAMIPTNEELMIAIDTMNIAKAL